MQPEIETKGLGPTKTLPLTIMTESDNIITDYNAMSDSKLRLMGP